VPFDIPGVLQGADATERLEFAIAHRLPWQLARQVWKPISGVLSYATQHHYDTLLRLMDEPERSELGAPGVKEIVAASMVEAYRQGGEAEAWEDRLLSAPWGFGPQDIEIPVHTWHGTADTLAPPPMGRALEASLRHGHTTWCEGEGHGLWFKHWPEMLDTLIGAPAARPA